MKIFSFGEQAFSDDLYAIGAIRFDGPFRLHEHENNQDAPLSPFYIDLKKIPSHPKVLRDAIAILKRKCEKLTFDVIMGVPRSGILFALTLAYELDVPLIVPRFEKKTHGLEKEIDGDYKSGNKALIVDDVATRGQSILKTIQHCGNSGLIFQDVFVIVDREQGAVEELRKNGYILHSALALKSLLQYYLKSGYVAEEEYQKIMSYLNVEADAHK